MSQASDKLKKIEDTIKMLERDLSISKLTFRRICNHLNLMKGSLSVLSQVAGSNSPEVRSLSKLGKEIEIDGMLMNGETWKSIEKTTSPQKRDDFYASYTSAMIKTTNKVLSVFKKLRRSHYPSLLRNTSPIQDSEFFLKLSKKQTILQASGIIISNYIARELIELLRKENISYRGDDIDQLCERLKMKTNNSSLKAFLKRSYYRVKIADKVRNSSAHVDVSKLLPKEIEQSIEFAKLLKKFL